MGPLFSLGLMAILGAIVVALAFIVLVAFRFTTKRAILVAFAFCIGGGCGAAIVGTLGYFVLGPAATLETSAEVATYLGSMAGVALATALLAARYVAMRSNPSLARGFRARER
jgi:hypothetical protein